MRVTLSIALWVTGATAAVAQTPYLSKGWTFDEPDGASLYLHVCAACHQVDGEGASGAGAYPALRGDLRLASTDYVLSVLLGGQHAMPALGHAMSDVQLSDLVNYTLSRGGSEKSLAFWRILDSF
jgi:mono/diheme cytochrome c family protein